MKERRESSTMIRLFAAFPLLAAAKELEVYYESLCPDSVHLFDELPSVLEKNPDLTVKLFPFGNARFADESHKVMECQHSDTECAGNNVQACVLQDEELNEKLKLSVVTCMMTTIANVLPRGERYWTGKVTPDMYKSKVARPCLAAAGLETEVERFWFCAKDQKKLAWIGEKTESLGVNHVPWVVIDGQRNEQAIEADDDIATALAFEKEKAEVGLIRALVAKIEDALAFVKPKVAEAPKAIISLISRQRTEWGEQGTA